MGEPSRTFRWMNLSELLPLQLFLELVEEAHVGALADDLLRVRLDEPGLVQAEGPESNRILQIVVTPLSVRRFSDGLERVVVLLRPAFVHENPDDPLRLARA